MDPISFILPFYHTVSDESLTHAKHLYHLKTRRAFIDDLEFMAKHYDFVGLEEFHSYANGGFGRMNRPVVHLSFDDGLRECYDIIFPILYAKGIPATFFLNTDFIDNKKMFYRFKSSIIKELIIELKEGNSALLKNVMSVGYKDELYLDQLAERYGLSFDDYLKCQRPYMTWEQAEELVNKGFTVGAHSIDHPEFRHIDRNEALRQVTESSKIISSRFVQDTKAFSFPFTDFQLDKDFFRLMKEKAGIDISFGTAGVKSDEVHWNFQRIPMEWPYSAREIIGSYKFKSKVRSLFGKNIIRR